MSAVHYDSYTEARAHLKDLHDAAERGRVATVRRDTARTAMVDVERLRHFLASIAPSRAQVVAEADAWSVFIPGLPVARPGQAWYRTPEWQAGGRRQMRTSPLAASGQFAWFHSAEETDAHLISIPLPEQAASGSRRSPG